MESEETKLDQDVKEIEECFLVHDFKMETVDEDEYENVEEKPIINLNDVDRQNKCILGDLEYNEDDRECKYHDKGETIEDENEEQYQTLIKSEDLIIKHEYLDEPDYIDINEPSDVDICSKCTVIVAVNDNPVPIGTADRAAQTLPKGTLILKSFDEPSFKVYTLRHLRERVQLGPYMGHTIKVESGFGYSWKLSGGRLVDTSDETSSNYLRYVNYARDISEKNLVAFQCNGELYYRTCRDIEKGEELLIYFEDNPGETFYKPDEETPNKFFMCNFCHLGLKFKVHRDRHQMFCTLRTDESNVGSLCKHFAVSKVSKTEDEGSQIESVGSTTDNSSGQTENKVRDLNRDTKLTQKRRNPLRCTECNYETYWKLSITEHKLQHLQKNIPINVLKSSDSPDEACYKMNLTGKKSKPNQKKNVFKCVDCEYETNSKNNLSNHKLRYCQKNAFKCVDCDFETDYKHILNKHKLKHKRKNMLKCTDCNYETSYKFNLNAHKLKHDPKNVFKCEYCNYETYSKYSLNKHIFTHGQKNVFKCVECDYETNSKYNLNRHKIKHDKTNIMKCALCDYETYCKSNLSEHKLRHNRNNVFKCVDCDYETYSRENFSRHKLKHDKKNILKCADCDYETYNKCNLNEHKLKHDQKNVFKCEDCSYETYLKYNLSMHKLKHDQKKVLKCADCDYETYSKYYLRRHELRHGEKNALKCSYCDYETYYKYNLKMHKLKHGQRKVFKCADCSYENYSKYRLREHKLSHDPKNVFKCVDCDYETYCKGTFNRHKLKHDKKNILKCADCNYETYFIYNLNKHKLTHYQNLK